MMNRPPQFDGPSAIWEMIEGLFELLDFLPVLLLVTGLLLCAWLWSRWSGRTEVAL